MPRPLCPRRRSGGLNRRPRIAAPSLPVQEYLLITTIYSSEPDRYRHVETVARRTQLHTEDLVAEIAPGAPYSAQARTAAGGRRGPPTGIWYRTARHPRNIPRQESMPLRLWAPLRSTSEGQRPARKLKLCFCSACQIKCFWLHPALSPHMAGELVLLLVSWVVGAVPYARSKSARPPLQPGLPSSSLVREETEHWDLTRCP